MALDLTDCQFHGPALPEPFVKFELEKELQRVAPLAKTTGAEGKKLAEDWEVCRRKLRALVSSSGAIRVFNHVIEPLLPLLGYARYEAADEVQTREDREDGGTLLVTEDGSAKLRVWVTAFNDDLYAPVKRGRAYRFSHQRIAQRVLLATGERLGLLTNGVQLLVLISDPARPDSTVTIPLDPGWKLSRDVPDSFRFLLALTSPRGITALPDLVDKARLQQARVTKELRVQARQAVEHFIQEVLDQPENRERLVTHTDHEQLARQLWREGLITVYRLLFILKLETSDDAARSFSFASTSLWRNTFSPSVALGRYAREVLERGVETGQLLEGGLRALFRMFEQGLECTELVVKPLGGALFGPHATPLLAELAWGERAVAWLLDRLLWTAARRGSDTRERVHYGPLDVEDLGRVYEALLELEPGISVEPMCRLRRQKLEVVVPMAQGERYRPADETAAAGDAAEDDASDDVSEDEAEEESSGRGKKTKVEWIEAIPAGRFYLRVGLGRKASGSYYTPHSFVRFLVQETLGPQVAERSPPEDPQPLKILELKVLDPAMGSGHFLVEACRYLGEKLYEACRLCDEKALALERKAEKQPEADRPATLAEARAWRDRVIALPDPDDELLRYLPSRSPEGEESGYSQKRAIALCRRLVATHCLYGVDKNPLAVELAKLALWLESHAEGMPLTFLDHRLIVGDSLAGPFWERLLTRPGKPKEPVEGVFSKGIAAKFTAALHEAIRYVRDLEASVGATVAEVERKRRTKEKLDRALLPFRVAAAAWSGGVMLGPEKCDDLAYGELLHVISDTGDLPENIESDGLLAMIRQGLGIANLSRSRSSIYHEVEMGRITPALSFDLAYPEVFYPTGVPYGRRGFHAVLGNPPWDRVRPAKKEFLANFDVAFLDAESSAEARAIEDRILATAVASNRYEAYVSSYAEQGRAHDALYEWQEVVVGDVVAGRGNSDLYMIFIERSAQCLRSDGVMAVLVPSGFHGNEGAAGVRQLCMKQMQLLYCYSFENRRKFFEIDSRFKFALVSAARRASKDAFNCVFYLHDDEWLFRERHARPPLEMPLAFVVQTGGDLLTIVELRGQPDYEVAKTCFKGKIRFDDVCRRVGVRLGRQCDMNRDAFRFSPTDSVCDKLSDPRDATVASKLIASGWLLLHDDKTFEIYSDLTRKWRPRYLVSVAKLHDKQEFLRESEGYILAFRRITGATNYRTCIVSLLPPGVLFGHTVFCDRDAGKHPSQVSLLMLAVMGSFVFDWCCRLKTATDLSFFIINGVPFPDISIASAMMSHSALRLVANHAGYAPLWREQLGDTWRESDKSPLTWPVLGTDDERWRVRAAIDAVVADAYGLSREQYAHVLSTFSHSSYKAAPELCLAAFDELRALGLEAFTKKHDPYWDIPLNEQLPQPVIDLPTVNGDQPAPPPIDGGEKYVLARPPATRSKGSKQKKPRGEEQ